MAKMIFVNLPVRDLGKSIAFYRALGFTQNPQLSSESNACMVWSETIHVMLLTHERWQTFTSRPIPPPSACEVMLALSCDERRSVDAMNEGARRHGGIGDVNPTQDHGFMYSRDFADPDGHVWEAFWMDPANVPPS